MMYSNKIAACIKVNGKVLREQKDKVFIPFGAEYTISIKNLHTTKAVVSIDIDGENVTDGSRYIVHPGETVEIEGFLRDNHVSHKFKFIEKTQEISDFRGDNIEDGLIKLTFQFERGYCQAALDDWWKKWEFNRKTDPFWNDSRMQNLRCFTSKGTGDWNGGNAVYGANLNTANCCLNNTDLSNPVSSVNDAGITARGGQSDQTFQTGYTRELEAEVHTMVLQLKGAVGNKYVQTPLTTKTKVQCENCGRKWRSSQEFCGNCGTSLRF